MASAKSISLGEESGFAYVSKHPSIPQSIKPDVPLFASPGFATMVPRSIVIITSEPFLETSKGILKALYNTMKNGPLFPFETHVMHLVMDLPAPCSIRELRFEVGESCFHISLPQNNKLPLMDVNLGSLFSCLDLSNVLKVFRAVLLERNVIFMSKYEEKLTDCAMGILSLLFPFKWRLIFVPVLPSLWIDYMSSPVSFVMGALADCEDDILARCMGEELLVDLDKNTVCQACTFHLSPFSPPPSELPELPDHYGQKLINELTKTLISESGCKLRIVKLEHSKIKLETTNKIRDSFLKFFVSVLLNYKGFLNHDSSSPEDPGSHFNKSGFLDTFGHNSAKLFLGKMMETQMFANFCDTRIQAITSQDCENLFFDEHIIAKRNRSKILYPKMKTPFLDGRSKKSKILFQVPPIQAAFSRSPEFQSYPKFPSFSYQVASRIGLPKTTLPNLLEFQEENSPPPLSPLRCFEAPRRQGIACVFLTWLQMWARTLRCQQQSEVKVRITELLSVFEMMYKKNSRPIQGDFKLVLDACVKVDSSHALPIFTYMSRNNVMVDSETLSILHKYVSRRSRCIPSPPVHLSAASSDPHPRVFTRLKDTRVFASKEVRFFMREHCTQCGYEFPIAEVMRMWQINSDAEIECKACRRAFAPDFQVRVGLEIGSASTGLWKTSTVEGVALYSPFQLRAKSSALAPVEDLMAMRTFENALFWNLIWYFSYFGLPYEFLLPYEPMPAEPLYRISIADESPRTVVESFTAEACRISQVAKSLQEDAETQTTIILSDPL